ncbi:MAG TPA: dienelactone hydrolase family protein [Pseudomonadales bacterium]|nr:dienelactone hydrolase family protein [Pseudomonadales bacterium]
MHTIETVDVDGSPMEVFLFRPEGEGPHPGLILAQHLPGGHAGLEHDEFTLVTAERFARHGFVVAVPFVFHWWPKAEEMMTKAKAFRDDWTVADLRATFDLLAARDDVDAARIGIVGHCWGGRVAWLGACHLPLAACAIFYGGRIRLAMGPGAVPAIDLAGRIACPVAGFFGNDDTNPPPEDVDACEAALAAAGVAHEFHRYDGAGHAFQNFPTPERYRETQSEDAWTKVLAFLDRSLGRA